MGEASDVDTGEWGARIGARRPFIFHEVERTSDHGYRGCSWPALIRELDPEFRDDAAFVLEMAEYAAAIEHPAFERVERWQGGRSRSYWVQERFEGWSMADWLRASGPLTAATASPILVAISEAVDALHRQRSKGGHPLELLYRLLAPEAVIITPGGDLKLRNPVFVRIRRICAAPDSRLDPAGLVALSPEQVRAEEIGAQADVYGIGALAYTMLTGRPLFAGGDALAIAGQILDGAFIDPRELNAEIPGDVAALISQALSKDPVARPTGAAGFAAALRSLHPVAQQPTPKLVAPAGLGDPRVLGLFLRA